MTDIKNLKEWLSKLRQDAIIFKKNPNDEELLNLLHIRKENFKADFIGFIEHSKITKRFWESIKDKQPRISDMARFYNSDLVELERIIQIG